MGVWGSGDQQSRRQRPGPQRKPASVPASGAGPAPPAAPPPAHLRQEAPHKAPRQAQQQQDAAQHGHAGAHVRGRHLGQPRAAGAPNAALAAHRGVASASLAAARAGRGCQLAVRRRQPLVQLVSPVLEHAGHVIPLSKEVGHRQLRHRLKCRRGSGPEWAGGNTAKARRAGRQAGARLAADARPPPQARQQPRVAHLLVLRAPHDVAQVLKRHAGPPEHGVGQRHAAAPVLGAARLLRAGAWRGMGGWSTHQGSPRWCSLLHDAFH